MTVAEAYERRVCRICEQPVCSVWRNNPGTLLPGAVILNYGSEFAHEGCLEKEEKKKMSLTSIRQLADQMPASAQATDLAELCSRALAFLQNKEIVISTAFGPIEIHWSLPSSDLDQRALKLLAALQRHPWLLKIIAQIL